MDLESNSLVHNLRVWASQSDPVRPMLLICLLLILVHRVFRSSNARSPPVAPYWIPWLGSAATMAKDPDTFFKRNSEKLGPVFRILAAGKDITYVTSPSLINAIYRDSKTFEFAPIRLDMSEKVFSVPKDVCNDTYMVQTYLPSHHRALSPTNVPTILERYVRGAYKQLTHVIKTLDGSTTPLTSLVIPPAYSAAATAIFGKSFPAEKTYPGFAKFNGVFHILSAGVPRFLFPGPFKAWDEVIGILKEYIEELRVSGKEMPEWIRMTLDASAEAGWSDDAIATLLGGDLWALEGNAIWAAYWVIVFLLQTPQGLKPIITEVDAAREDWLSARPGLALTAMTFPLFLQDSSEKFPLLTSSILEALRLCSWAFSIRRVTAPTEFAGFHFNTGDRLICATRSVHLDEDIYDDASSFVIDRFVDGQKKYYKDGKYVPNHFMAFGGGVSMCEGRHFAQGLIKAFLALLLTHATIEVAPDATWPELNKDRIGVGMIDPKGDLNVIVKKRTL